MHFQHAGPGPIGLWDQTGHHQGRALPVLNGEEQGLILLGRIVIIPAIRSQVTKSSPIWASTYQRNSRFRESEPSGGSASGGRSSAA